MYSHSLGTVFAIYFFPSRILGHLMKKKIDPKTAKIIQPKISIEPKLRNPALYQISWNSNTLATWCEELTHLKRLWCWERLKAGGDRDRGWDGWMASPTQWTWVWVNSGSWRWVWKPGMLQSMGSQRVRYNWATELNWTETIDIQRDSFHFPTCSV